MLEGEYKAICLDKYLGKMHVANKTFRNLQPKEILVRVEYATINSYDLIFIAGQYGEIEPTKFPMVPGFEGSGEIVKVSDNADRNLIGKRVACFANSNKEGYFEGLWAQYHYTTIENLMVFDEEIPYEKICFLINPLTATGMLDITKKAKATSVLQTGADSSVGEMFIRLCQKEKIQTINLVKNYKRTKDLFDMNAKNVIVCETDWENEVKKLCYQLNCQLAFDSIGGSLFSKILTILPDDSEIYHYGSFTEKEITRIPTNELIFKGKKILGFWIIRWLRSLSAEEYQLWWDYIKNELSYKTNTFKTNISNVFIIDDFKKAIDYYGINIFEGSVLLKP